jgi:putative spermidine/putrescine transport system permease protein
MGWGNEAFRLYVAHSALTLPYVVRVVTASLTGFDINQELAARNLGAHPLEAFARVTLPQIGPGLVAGGVFAFIVSFDNLSLSIFLAGASYKTLPVELFSYVSDNTDPMAAAVSVVMILVSVIVIALVERIVGLQRLMRG